MIRRGVQRLGIGMAIGVGYDRLVADRFWGMRRFSYFDRAWSTGVAAIGKLTFFDDGLGTPDQIRIVENYRNEILENKLEGMIDSFAKSIVIKSKKIDSEYLLVEGELDSKLELEEELWPKECRKGYFQLVLPVSGVIEGIAIQTAGTGDHGFKRRREIIAKPLIQEHNIASCIMENPYYARRKPDKQQYSGLRSFVDLITLSMGVGIECNALAKWLKEELGIERICVTGLSLGGHTAALTASISPVPMAAAPGFAWSTSTGVWTTGALSNRIDWAHLESDINAHPGYEPLFKSLGTGLDRWFERDQEIAKEIESLPELKSTQEVAENIAKSKLKLLANHFSHLGNYPVPKDASLIHYVLGEYDYFYSRDQMTGMDRVWPGTTYDVLPAGHVDGFLLYGRAYRNAINTVMNRLPEARSKSVNLHALENVPCEEIVDGQGTDVFQKAFQYCTVQTVNFLQRS